MNWVAVVLGIVIIILLYVLFKYFTTSSTTLSTNANLMVSNPPITSINSPKNLRYAYGVWIYINTWDPNANKTIFSRAGNITLRLDKTTPSLYCDIAMNDGTKTSVLITSNFPIQKWCQVIVSLDSQYIDCYLDGKLVVSKSVFTGTAMPATPPDSTAAGAIILGNSPATSATASYSGFDASIMGFTRWTGPVDPQTAWDSYMSQSGKGKMANALSAYGINLNILQDNIVQNTYRLY
jgi:hypothetical protein